MPNYIEMSASIELDVTELLGRHVSESMQQVAAGLPPQDHCEEVPQCQKE